MPQRFGGTAIADQLLSSRDIKDGSIKLKDLARGVRGQLSEDGRKGVQGPAGLPGTDGEPGAAGPNGPQGPRGINALQLGGRMSSTAQPSDPVFHAVIGGSGGGLSGSGVGAESASRSQPLRGLSAPASFESDRVLPRRLTH